VLEEEMLKPSKRGPRLLCLFLLGLLAFNYPLLAIVNVNATVFGVPLLYAYLFLAWGSLIALVAWVVEKSD
jgi:hypothetical protein